MTKNEFTDALNECNNQIKDLQEKKKNLRKEYIESNATFRIGDKVNIVDEYGKEYICYISNYRLGFNHVIRYMLRKCKRDGTMAKVGEFEICARIKSIEKI